MKYYISNFYSTPNYDLYRTINSLRSMEDWGTIVTLCEKELSLNRDFFIIARLMEALCGLYGAKGLEESIILLNSIDLNNFLPENNIHKIISWINMGLWQCVFKNKDFYQCEDKFAILHNIIKILPNNLDIMKNNIQKYLEIHDHTEVSVDISKTEDVAMKVNG